MGLNMNASDIAAWFGAVTGSLALLWDIIKWSKAGARLRISVSPDMTALGEAKALIGKETCAFVEANNIGDAKTTITHLVAFYYRSRFRRLLRLKPSRIFFVPDPAPGRLPHVLDKGERWVGMITQDEDLVKMNQDGFLFCGVYHSTSERPVLARLIIRDV